MTNFRPVDPASLGIEPGHVEIDTSIAHPARIYDYALGGKDNYPADRDAAERILELIPTGRAEVRGNRQFLNRAVRYAASRGIDQFLDIGTGIPTMGPTHEAAAAHQPEARVVYVDNDPIVLVHARALLVDNDRTAVMQADFRDPRAILAKARQHLDFTEPIGLMFVGLLYFVPDDDGPAELVETYKDAMPGGSMMLLSHVRDTPEMLSARRIYQETTAPLTPRSDREIREFFAGWDLVEPGVTDLHDWRPEGDEVEAPHIAGGVAVKPES